MKKIERFMKWITKIKCKCVSSCCSSKCSVNDTDGDGKLDTIEIESNETKIKISSI